MSRISPHEEDGQDLRCLALQVWWNSTRMMASETTTDCAQRMQEVKWLIVTWAPPIAENALKY